MSESSSSEAAPRILGHRGAPLIAPENTLASLRAALAEGLDGFEYDLQPCASGEAVLLHDDTLERTTDGHGPIAARTLPELSALDAGAWFHKSFAGERLPLFEEALELRAPGRDEPPIHMIELKHPSLVGRVARALRERGPLPFWIASFYREVVVEARDLGLPAMLLAVAAEEHDREFVARERIDAHGVGPGGWRTPVAAAEWPCQRWSWSVDEPADLLEACRAPLYGINSNEGPRALAVRALVRLAPRDRGAYPLQVGELVVDPARFQLGRGEWCGDWRVAARVRNPFEWPVEIECALAVRQGAFELSAPPAPLRLAPGEERAFEIGLTGGSFSPGGDPCLRALYRWRAGAAPRELALDAPLHRVRVAQLRREPLRLALLCEQPGDRPASLLIKRIGRDLLVSIEGAGGLEDAHVLVHFDGQTLRGSRGLRIALPADFDARSEGARFACGIEGREGAQPGARMRLRRWSGGLPGDVHSGVPGRLVRAH